MNQQSEFKTNNGHTRLLKPTETGEMLGLSTATLATWRCTQRYDLPYVKIGKNVMYRLEDVEQFILDNLNTAA